MTQQSSSPIEGHVFARFTTTPEEFIQAILALSGVLYGFGGMLRAHSLWRRLMIFLTVAMVSFLTLTVGHYLILQQSILTPRDFSVAIFAAIFAGFAVLIGLGQFQMRRMRRALRGMPAEENVEVLATETGIWWNTQTQKHFWLYTAFDQIIAFKDGYYLVTGLSGGFIPGRGFGNDIEKAAFETLLKEKLPIAATAQFFAAKAQHSR